MTLILTAMSNPDQSTTTADGRKLNLWLSGAEDGRTLVFHRGTPDPPAPWPEFERAAVDFGLRVVSYARPGYSGSTRHRGRDVAAAAADTESVLDALGVAEFIALGHSGGGPHALACAALLPGRCLAGVTVASVAPHPAAGLDWLEGMAEENVVEFGHAVEGEDSYRAFLEKEIENYADVSADDVVAALGGLISDVDKAVLTGDMAERSAQNLRRVARDGLDGWIDDGLAFIKPWGFELEDITTPTSIWQGRHDKMVPFSHGHWLVTRMPQARAHLLEEEGHLTLLTTRLGDILADAVDAAGV